MPKRTTYKPGTQRIVVQAAPSPIARPAMQLQRRSSGNSSALRRWKDKYQQVRASARNGLARVKSHFTSARGIAAAGAGGGAVALAEEYLVEDVAGLPTAIPVTIGFKVLATRGGRMAADFECMAHGAAGVAGYQLTRDYVIDALTEWTS